MLSNLFSNCSLDVESVTSNHIRPCLTAWIFLRYIDQDRFVALLERMIEEPIFARGAGTSKIIVGWTGSCCMCGFDPGREVSLTDLSTVLYLALNDRSGEAAVRAGRQLVAALRPVLA